MPEAQIGQAPMVEAVNGIVQVEKGGYVALHPSFVRVSRQGHCWTPEGVVRAPEVQIREVEQAPEVQTCENVTQGALLVEESVQIPEILARDVFQRQVQRTGEQIAVPPAPQIEEGTVQAPEVQTRDNEIRRQVEQGAQGQKVVYEEETVHM